MDIEELLKEIQLAASDETRWPSVLAKIADFAEAEGACLCSILEPSAVRSFCCSHGLPEGFGTSLLSVFDGSESCLHNAREEGRLAAGQLVRIEDLVAPAQGWVDGCPHAIALQDLRHCIGIVLTDERDSHLGPRCLLMLWRPSRLAGFSNDTERKLNILAPHLMRVLTTHWKRRGQRMTIGWDEQKFALIESPFFLLSENGQLMYGSRAGLTLLRSGGHLTLRDGRLWCGETALIECFDPQAEEPFESPATAPDNTALHVTPLNRGQLPQPLFQWFPQIAFLVMVRSDWQFARRRRSLCAASRDNAVRNEGPVATGERPYLP